MQEDGLEGSEMTLDDAAWVFTAVIFAAVVGCTIWIIKEERKK